MNCISAYGLCGIDFHCVMRPSEQINQWYLQAEREFQNPIDWATWTSFVLDVTALKPGNVYCGSEGHGMTVGDFLQSAWVTCIEICNPSYRLGQRIERSAQATLEKVGKNTNLGIILLCAPLLHACQHRTGDQTLQQSVKTNIDNADLNDAEGLNRAIRLMRPAGLGKVSEHDVWNSAQVPDSSDYGICSIAGYDCASVRQQLSGNIRFWP